MSSRAEKRRQKRLVQKEKKRKALGKRGDLTGAAARQGFKNRVSSIEYHTMTLLQSMRELTRPGGLLSRFDIMIEMLGKKALGIELDADEEAAFKEAVLGPEAAPTAKEEPTNADDQPGT